MDYAPTNEQGVVLLFGRLAPTLGFCVEHVQTHCPDCTARHRGKLCRIEFEYSASHYSYHRHPPDGADVIVCWENDWESRPRKYSHLEIIDLKKYAGALPRVFSSGCSVKANERDLESRYVEWNVPRNTQVGDLILIYRAMDKHAIHGNYILDSSGPCRYNSGMIAGNPNLPSKGPKTLMEAVRYFADADVCHAYMASLKWPDGIVKCPECGSADIGNIASRRMYQCKAKACRKQFSVKVGTIFEDSPLPLDKWFVAVWSITNAKNGISSCELARALGITQKSAWHLLHRVRTAMKTGTFEKFTGTCEADETYVGGKVENFSLAKRKKFRDGYPVGVKSVVQGIVHRGGRAFAKVVPDATTGSLRPNLLDAIERGSTLYTDMATPYQHMETEFYHWMIDHGQAYVDGVIHTNSVENFWSLFKRMLNGTYIHVDAAHLQRYLDEQVFRFDERKKNDAGRFATVMPGIVGRRLTWKALVGKS